MHGCMSGLGYLCSIGAHFLLLQPSCVEQIIFDRITKGHNLLLGWPKKALFERMPAYTVHACVLRLKQHMNIHHIIQNSNRARFISTQYFSEIEEEPFYGSRRNSFVNTWIEKRQPEQHSQRQEEWERKVLLQNTTFQEWWWSESFFHFLLFFI